jgi:hypothetical protein
VQYAVSATGPDLFSRLACVHLLAVAIPHLPDEVLSDVFNCAIACLEESGLTREEDAVSVPLFSIGCTALRALCERKFFPPQTALAFVATHCNLCVSFDAFALLHALWQPEFAQAIVTGTLYELQADTNRAQLNQLLLLIAQRLPDFADITEIATRLCALDFGDHAAAYFQLLKEIAPLAVEDAVRAWLRLDGLFLFGLDVAEVVMAAMDRGIAAGRRRCLVAALLEIQGQHNWFHDAVDVCAWATTIARLLQTIPGDSELQEGVRWMIEALARTEDLGGWPRLLALEIRLSTIMAGWLTTKVEFEALAGESVELNAYVSNYHRRLFICAMREGCERWPEIGQMVGPVIEAMLVGVTANGEYSQEEKECHARFDMWPYALDELEIPGFMRVTLT